MSKKEVNFYETHKDFVSLFSELKECTTETIEGLCTKIVDYLRDKEDDKELIAYVKKRLYTGICGRTGQTRRGFAVSLIRLLRAFPQLQSSAYPDMIKYTKPVGKVHLYAMSQYFIGRIFGYNILLRIGLFPKIKHELLMKISNELCKFSKDSSYVEDLCVTTLCAIYDQTKETAVSDALWKRLPNDTNYWTPFHIGSACHILCSDHERYGNKLRKKFSDPSIFIQKLFIRQCEGVGDSPVFAWKPLARYGMMDKTLKWKDFWKDMRYILSRPTRKFDFSYQVFTGIIGALPGNSDRIEEVLGGEFSRQFVYWVKKKLNMINLRRVFMGFLENEDAVFLFQLAAALIGVKDFDKRIGAPIYEQIMARPASKRFDFGVITDALVNRWTEVRKPFIEATEDTEEDIDEVGIEAQCKIINEKLQRLCATRDFANTGNPDWWVAGLKFFLRWSCFHSQAKRAKLEVSQHEIFTRRGLSIIAAHINTNLPWLEDDGWKIDKIFELIDPEAMLKQYGPRLLNNADPTPEFKLAENFLKMLPSMDLTVVQRRVCELTAKTCRLLLITESYSTCSRVFHVLLQEDLTVQDKMFEVVLALIENILRLCCDLAFLIWKIFAKTATNKQIEQIIEIISPNLNLDAAEYDDAGEQDGDAVGKKGGKKSVRDQAEEKEGDKGDKSMDVDEPKNEKPEENDKEIAKPVGEKTEKKKDEGDKCNNSSDIQEPEKKDSGDQGEKSAEDAKVESVEQNVDAETSSSSSSSSSDDEETDKDEGGPSPKEELGMLKKIVMAIAQKNSDGSRRKEIQKRKIPKVMRLMEIFAEVRVGDSLVLTIICPMLERYCSDPDVFGSARRIILKIVRRKQEEELPLKGVDMPTMEAVMGDAIHVMLRSKAPPILEWVHRCPIHWLFKIYFKIAEKEGKLAEAEKWVQEQYNGFWSGLVKHQNRYRYISLSVFRDAFMRFPMLLDSMLKHVFLTLKEEKVTRAFDQFQTLCFISQAAVWRERSVSAVFKAWHVEYAKTFCKLLPNLKKKMHKKTVLLNFIKFVKTTSEEERSALLKGSDLETMLTEMGGERASRLLSYLTFKG